MGAPISHSNFYDVSEFSKIVEENEAEVARTNIGYGQKRSVISSYNSNDYKEWFSNESDVVFSSINFFLSKKNLSKMDNATLVFFFAEEDLDSLKIRILEDVIKHCLSKFGGKLKSFIFVSEHHIDQNFKEILVSVYTSSSPLLIFFKI